MACVGRTYGYVLPGPYAPRAITRVCITTCQGERDLRRVLCVGGTTHHRHSGKGGGRGSPLKVDV